MFVWWTCKNVWILRVWFLKSRSIQAKKCPGLPYFTLLAFFEVIQLQHRIKLFLEKIVVQDVSTIYSQILRNACETTPVIFCLCISKNVYHTMRLTWHICVPSLYLWYLFFHRERIHFFVPIKVFCWNYLLWPKKYSTDEKIFSLFFFSQFEKPFVR